MRAAGYRTGFYTSPHLHTFRERIQVSGHKITREQLVALVEEVRPLIERIPGVTTFEAITAIGFLYFARSEVDVAVVEVGLGGRLDATNVLTPEVSAITSLSLDHTYLLGDTLAEIAYEKAGIIKSGIPAVSAPQRAEAIKVLETVSRERHAPLIEDRQRRRAGARAEIRDPRHGLRERPNHLPDQVHVFRAQEPAGRREPVRKP